MTAEQSRESYADHSTVVGLARDASVQLRSWIATSWLTHVITTLGTAFDDATRTSRLAATLQVLGRWLCGPYLYRWLTAEPDPNVIVIDLRETYAVGPFIAPLNRVQPNIESTWNASAVRRIVARLEPNRELFTRSHTVQLLAAALEPLELPEEEKR